MGWFRWKFHVGSLLWYVKFLFGRKNDRKCIGERRNQNCKRTKISKREDMTLQHWVSQLWPYSIGFFSYDLPARRYRFTRWPVNDENRCPNSTVVCDTSIVGHEIHDPCFHKKSLVRESIANPCMDFQKSTDINMDIHDFLMSVFNYPYKRRYPHWYPSTDIHARTFRNGYP